MSGLGAHRDRGGEPRPRAPCEKLPACASPLLLDAQEIEPHAGCHLGNFPQVFSHLALINACVHLIPLGTSGPPPFDKRYQSDIMLIGDRVAGTTASEEASR
jgi:hypothetical protein